MAKKLDNEEKEPEISMVQKLKERTEKVEKEKAEKKAKGEPEEKVEEKKPKKDLSLDLGIKVDKKELLVPLEEYVKAGIHLATYVITPDMRQYVYRRRADGLAILNTNMINDKLKTACEFLSKYPVEEIILVCKREAGWKAAKLFSSITGIRVFTKKYSAGIITNPSLKDFFEPSLVVVCDPWLDKNAIHDASLSGIPVISLCDSNNLTRNIDAVIPCNNKIDKSIGIVLYILAREYCKKNKIEFKAKISEFTGEIEEKK